MARQGGDLRYRSPEQPCGFGYSAACGGAASACFFARLASFGCGGNFVFVFHVNGCQRRIPILHRRSNPTKPVADRDMGVCRSGE